MFLLEEVSKILQLPIWVVDSHPCERPGGAFLRPSECQATFPVCPRKHRREPIHFARRGQVQPREKQFRTEFDSALTRFAFSLRCLQSGLGWIKSAWMKGVAPHDSPDAFPTATQQSILPHGLDEILTTGRHKPAVGAEPWTDEHLIPADERNQDVLRHLSEFAGPTIHAVGLRSLRRNRCMR